MKYIAIIILALFLIVPASVSAAGSISAVKVEGTIYQFSIIGDYEAPVRWSFGDGATAEGIEPVHEFAEGEYLVRAEDANGTVWELSLDTRPAIMDTDDGTLNVGGFSTPGAALLVSCTAMFILAKTNNHILGDYIGKWKSLLMVAYLCGIVIGAVLVFTSLYPGVGA